MPKHEQAGTSDGRRIAKELFFTLPPAGFFLLLFFKLGAPWSYVFLALSVVFFYLAARVVLKRKPCPPHAGALPARIHQRRMWVCQHRWLERGP
jgi:hypothetical protein